MLWIPANEKLLVQTNVGSVGTTSPGTQVTTGASSTTKGDAAECIASTSFDAYWITIMASGLGTNTVSSRTCLDILTGDATEHVLIPDLLAGAAPLMTAGMKHWHFPLYLPSGTRIAARAASERTSFAFPVAIILYGGTTSPPWPVGGKVDTYGITTVPTGTTVTPGASGAEGSWTQIVASTSRDHFAIVPSFQMGGDTDWIGRGMSLDIGVGSATEQEIGGPYVYGANTQEQLNGPQCVELPAFHHVPSGTRLVARLSNSGTNETAGSYDVALHGVS